MPAYARPTTLPEALTLMSAGQLLPLAGGTDIYPLAGPEIDRDVIDLTAIAGLSGIARAGGALRIGGATTWAAITAASLPPALAALQEAAVEVGGRQIQNVGTIGGNLCNASPAADGVPPLLAVDAAVELQAPGGTRRLPLADFITGPRQTLRRPDELLVAVIVPEAALAGRSRFLKLGARAHLVISIAMVAVRLVVTGGRITTAHVAVGACSAVARRLPAVEAALEGAPVQDAAARVTRTDVAAALAPLDDIRATADYRLDAAVELVRRAIAEALT